MKFYRKGEVMKDYPETHQYGLISIKMDIEEPWPVTYIKGDLDIQIAKDGRIWICIDGIAFLRFRPLKSNKEESRW